MDQCKPLGLGLQAAAMGISVNNINVRAADAYGNQITTQPVSASGAPLNIKCTFALNGSGPAAVVGMTQSTSYIGDGVSAVGPGRLLLLGSRVTRYDMISLGKTIWVNGHQWDIDRFVLDIGMG